MSADWKYPDIAEAKVTQLAKIRETRNGKVRYTELSFERNKSLLLAALEMNPDIPERRKSMILMEALFAPHLETAYNPTTLLDRIRKLESDYLKKPLAQWHLVSNLSIKNSVHPITRNISNCRIVITNEPPAQYDRSKIMDPSLLKLYGLGEYPKDYAYVRISCLSRNDDEAASKALKALNTLRGIWNLILGWNKYVKRLAGPPHPLGSIQLGPIHTLHNSEGEMSDAWLYEPQYRGPVRSVNMDKEGDELIRLERYFRRRLQRHKNTDRLMHILEQYALALDYWDYDACFLRLWNIIEQLICTHNVDEVSKRMAFLWKPKEHRSIIKLLGEYRNKHVHTSYSDQNVECLVQDLKYYIDKMITFILDNRLHVDRLDELIKFLDLPNDKESLSSRVKLANAALRLFAKREE